MLYLIIGVALIGVLIFVPVVRRVLGALIAIGITLASIALAAFGVAILMNNVSINERPGTSARLRRFLAVNWAATSDKGLGAVTCEESERSAGELEQAAEKVVPVAKPRKRPTTVQATASPTPTATPTPATASEDIYPELVQRGYPGVPRPTLFKLARDTVNELGGWKVVKADEKTFTLECVYTTRLLHFDDDVKIAVTPRGEIHLCSRSRVGKGDLGANIGHIKEFYSALEPRIEEFYKEEEKKQNAKPPTR